MKLEDSDVKEMASNLEASFPGLATSLGDMPLHQEQSRSVILSALQIMTEAAVGQVFLSLVARANNLLRDVEPGKSSDEIVALVGAAFQADFVLPAKKNAARVMLVANAVLEQLRKRLIQAK